MKWFLLVAFSMNVALAGDCDPVNLVTEPGSPFKDIPTLDQDGSNTCYAFAAAQQINYYLLKKGDKRKVHPAWAALTSVRRGSGIGALWGSTPEFSVQGIQKEGGCSYDYITTELRRWARLGNATESQFLALIDSLTWKVNDKKGQKLSKADLKAMFFKSSEDLIPNCRPDPMWQQLAPALEKIAVINSDQIFREIVFPQCKKAPQSLNLPKPQVHGQDVMRMTLVPRLNKLMDDNRVPISLSYCSRMLKTPTYQGLLPPQKNNTLPFKEDCGLHASLLVGKKKIGGVCHFLLRNSWGTGFGKSNEHYKCLCKHIKTGAYVDNCHISTHNNGEYQVDSCWIPYRQFPLNTVKYSILK